MLFPRKMSSNWMHRYRGNGKMEFYNMITELNIYVILIQRYKLFIMWAKNIITTYTFSLKMVCEKKIIPCGYLNNSCTTTFGLVCWTYFLSIYLLAICLRANLLFIQCPCYNILQSLQFWEIAKYSGMISMWPGGRPSILVARFYISKVWIVFL